MTAAPELYLRQGSRFVRADRARRPVPPIPTPVPVDAEPDARPTFTAVPVARCRHGRFARYAARNCCPGGAP